MVVCIAALLAPLQRRLSEDSGVVDVSAMEVAEQKVMDAVRKHFRPELLNRLDDIVIFRPLEMGGLRTIVRLQLESLIKRLKERDIEIAVSDDALDLVLRMSFNPAYGARPVKRFIEKHMATELSKLIISGDLKDHTKVDIGVDSDGAGFSYTFNGRARSGSMKASWSTDSLNSLDVK